MASTPVTQGSIIKPSSNGLNDLFSRIETLRGKHLTASQAAGSSTTGITSAFPTNVAVRDALADDANVSRLKSNIDAVAASGSFVANRGSVATAITVPSVGSLIKATDFNAWDTVVTNMENVCAHYDRYSRYDEYSHYSHYGSRYDEYGQYGKYGHYGSRYGAYSRGCFIQGTFVLLSDYTYKPIEDVSVGEIIFSFNEDTKEMIAQKVIDKKEHTDILKVIKITFENNLSIILTEGHPILTAKGWKAYTPELSVSIHNIYTKKLNCNDSVLGLNNQYLKIIDIEELTDGPYICYNLSVEKNHNFFVFPSKNDYNISKEVFPIIAHNGKVCITSIC